MAHLGRRLERSASWRLAYLFDEYYYVLSIVYPIEE